MAESDSTPPKLDVERVKSLLATRALGKHVVYKQITETTMDDARTLAAEQGYPHGTVVIAERQMKGRGMKDHKWDSSNTGNLYLSFVLYLTPDKTSLEGRFSVEVAACLAALQALHELDIKPGVPKWPNNTRQPMCKWPNDIWVRGLKLAGFLAEDGRHTQTDSPGQDSSLVILGIGINVNADIRKNAELCSLATSIYCEMDGHTVDREMFLASICNRLEERLAWPTSALLEKFRADNVFQNGMAVTVHDFDTDSDFDAVFLSIEDNWDVCLSGVPVTVGNKSGTVRGNFQRFSLRPRASP